MNQSSKVTNGNPDWTQDVPPLMTEMVAWLNGSGQVHPVLASGVAQFQLVHIRPFLDGNGRTSLLLSPLCLYRAGYDFKRLYTISEYYDRDRATFYAAIQCVRERGMDLTGWLEHFVDEPATQLAEVRQRGERIIQWSTLAKEHGYIRAEAFSYFVSSLLSCSPDTDNEAFLEVMVAAKADYLATGSIRHFPEESRSGITVISPKQFCVIIRA